MATWIFLLIASTILSSCGTQSSSATAADGDAGPPVRGGSARIGLAKEPPIINPWLAPGAMSVTSMMTDGTSEPLVTLEPGGAWIPILARRVPTPENGDVTYSNSRMAIRVQIQQKAIWSDGVPVTCDDFAFTWKTVVNPDTQMNNRFGYEHIDRVDCPDSKTIIMHFRRRYSMYMSRVLAMPFLPKHELTGKDFNTYWNQRITLSNGPYIMTEWQRGVKIVLKRNKRWWRSEGGTKPYLDTVTFRFVKDANTLKMQLRMLENDLVILPSDTNLREELKQIPDITFDIRPGPVMEHLIFQTERAPLNNHNVRKALVYAIDREMITKVVMKNQVEPLQQALVPVRDYKYDDFAQYSPNSGMVAKYMKAAGYTKSQGLWRKRGKAIKLRYVVGAGSMPFRARVAQLLQEQLRMQGITMEINLVPTEILYAEVSPHGDFDIGEWSELTGIEPTPSVLLGCDQIPQKPLWAGKNRYRYCSKKVDQLMREADIADSEEARVKKIGEVNALVAEDIPLFPLFQSPEVNAWSLRFHGLEPNPDMGIAWNIEDWWMSP